MYAIFLLLLNQLLAAAGVVKRVPSDAEAAELVPNDADFIHTFNNDPGTFSTQFSTYFAEVQDRWQRAISLGLVDFME